MDDSWRVRIGSSLPRRRSTDFTSRALPPPADDFRDVFGGPPRSVFLQYHADSPSLVFSPPPSSYDDIFRLPSDLDPPPHPGKSKTGRSLPVFQIPDQANPNRHRYHEENNKGGNFYDDIFGSRECYEYEWRSRSRSASMSKSNSSSVLSSEELSPIQTMPMPLDDAGFSSFASKLRPINVSSLSGRRSSTIMARRWQSNSDHGVRSSHPPPSWCEEFVILPADADKLKPSFAKSPISCYDLNLSENNPLSEIVTLGPSPQRSCVKSPSGLREYQAMGSLFSLSSAFDPQQLYLTSAANQDIIQDIITAVEDDDHEREIAAEQQEEGAQELLEGGAYVIEIGCEKRRDAETTEEEAVGVDEAIAWARQNAKTCTSDQNTISVQRHNSEAPLTAFQVKGSRRHLLLGDDKDDQEEVPLTSKCSTLSRKEYTETHFLLEIWKGGTRMDVETLLMQASFELDIIRKAEVSKELKKWESGQETEQPHKDMTMELLEEDIREWSSGKEGNIRSLLSTLQYILWPDSGWQPIPLSELIDIAQVRKAYQKARLYLHPDKFQHKGVTTPKKFTAEKIYNLLQDAWAVCNSIDVYVG